MKQLILKNRTLLLVLAAISVCVSVYLIAQESSDDDNACWKFYTENITSAGAAASVGGGGQSIINPIAPIPQNNAWATNGGYLLNECNGTMYSVEGSTRTEVQ